MPQMNSAIINCQTASLLKCCTAALDVNTRQTVLIAVPYANYLSTGTAEVLPHCSFSNHS